MTPAVGRRGDAPYTRSRERVLHAYRERREHGELPRHAMGSVYHAATASLRAGDNGVTTVEATWDEYHARRYLIDVNNRVNRSKSWYLGAFLGASA